MEKKRQELIDNYKAEQRAIKTRRVLAKTRDWGENIAALLCILTVGLAVTLVCVTVWNLGLGFIVIGAGVVIALVTVWVLVDIWADEQIEKARYRRHKEMRGED